jgi:intracellular septation protein A
MTPKRGRTALTMLFSIGGPIALYYLLRAAGLATYPALLITTVLPALSAVYQVLRHRKLDQLTLFMVVMTVLSAGAAAITGSDRFLLAKDAWLTAITGTWMLATTRSDRPVVYHFARFLLEGRVGPSGQSWEGLWEQLPAFRRVWRVANVIWGMATLLDAGVRFTMAYTLPVNLVPALNVAQYMVLFVFLQVTTNIYYFRAGLFNPRSRLYRAPTAVGAH